MKIVVIGSGKLGERHLNVWKKIKDVEIVGMVTRNPAKHEAIAHKYGTEAYKSIAEALDNTDVDVFDICTPTHTHVDYIKEAAMAKKHVICEKPLALTTEEAQEAIEICEQNNVQLLVGHTLRFFPEYVQAKEQIAQGAIGRTGVIRLERGVPHPPIENSWYANEQKSGGLILDLGIHEFDWILWAIGDVQRVMTKYVKHNDDQNNVLEYAFVTLRMVDGTIAHVELSWAETTFHTSFELSGDQGMITFNHKDSQPLSLNIHSHNNKGATGVQVPRSLQDKDPYYRQLEHFTNCLLEKEEPIVTAVEAMNAITLARAVIQSAESGQPVTLGEGRR